MSRRFTRLSLLLVLLLSSELWAIGLGDIKLDSALNEPLRADIVLLSATPDEIGDLSVTLASAETFARYGIDRPFFLQGLEFNIINGGVGGSVVQIRSRAPITEPFLTFLVEANWPSGRLLREYTVLLDPPTYAPPAAQEASPVAAPRRSIPSDSGRIDRQPPRAADPEPQQPSRPAPQPSQPARTPSSDPRPLPAADDTPYDATSGGDYRVARRDTLWGVASRMRPDSRLTMNQTMLAIFQANPEAFGGNINLLKEGASLRIPSADDIFRISRGDALSEVARQNTAWGIDTGYTPPDTTTSPSLTLVPPDDDPTGTDYDDPSTVDALDSREDEVQDRIAELEAADVPNQQSLIEIRDNELAALRQELANIRGEVYVPPVDEVPVEDPLDDPFVDTTGDAGVDDVFVDDDEVPVEVGTDEVVTDVDDTTTDAADVVPPTNVVRTDTTKDKSIVDKVIEFLMGTGGIIVGALVIVAGLLTWFMKRGADVDESGPWGALDSDDVGAGAGAMSATSTMQIPSRDEAMVVVEQESDATTLNENTIESAVAEFGGEDPSGSFGSLEDTFSSETAVNLDQTDPIAEADFHMAYGLYDQAADLINGALESDPSDTVLISKLCEIYFVWGNRDAFVDAATRLKAGVGDGSSSDWDKIVIMGQQIAADHKLFAGAAIAGVTKEVDLSFDDAGGAGGLDMDFGAEDASAADVIDLGGDAGETDGGVDFSFDDAASGSADDSSETTVETPTIDQPFDVFGGDSATADLPSLDETLGQAISASGQDADATAEINLDELDLDIDSSAATELASFDDLDATGQLEQISDTGINEALIDAADATGKNPEVDPNATGVREALEIESFEDLDATGEMRLATDETGRSPMIDAEHEQQPVDLDFDESLLDATGRTQILSEGMAVDTGANAGSLGDDDATLLAPVDDDFDFAKTEALPASAFGDDLEETGEAPSIAETDVDLDLDDLTAALKLSDAGDTVEQPRDDATVEQPRPNLSDETAEVPTMALAPEDMSDDLHDARTMTEVGTKLDLARAYVDMGDPAGARGILEEVLDEGDEGQKQQAQQLLDSLPT